MKKTISILLAVVMFLAIAVTMAGCGKEEAVPFDEKLGEVGFHLVAEKIGNIDREEFMTGKGGLFYKDENGKYGVMSLEGRYDTGAVYAGCFTVGDYFAVRKNAPKDSADTKNLNSVGLINGKGDVLVPFEYADFKVLSDRYIVVKTIDKLISSKDYAVITYNKDFESANVVEEEYYFTGSWGIYDVKKQKLVDGISGTTADINAHAEGQFLVYKNGENYKTLGTDGNLVDTTKTTIFDDGSYKVIDGRVGEVYSVEGEKIFDFDLAGYIPTAVEGDYYIAEKEDENYNRTYAVMDKTGKVVSKDFSTRFSIYGDFVLADNKLCNFEGKSVITNDVTGANQDKVFKDCVLAKNGDARVMIKSDETVIYQGVYDDDILIDNTTFLASKKVESDSYYYSFKDKDYTIKGYSFAPWLVRVKGMNDLSNIVDVTTGKVLFEGYNGYHHCATSDGSAYYVYAEYDGGADVFLITDSTSLEDTQTKKANLLDDLVAAFEKEGITVSVNKETGEMALDSSVLFGGDSAELTTDGKAFLNKFIKVYTEVAFSEKYAGFITKTMVEGHTAPLSTSTYASGLPLSEQRAENVKNYCLSKETGVDVSVLEDTLKDRGCSNSQPIYKEDGSVNMEASRRVSFRFMVDVEMV